MKLLSDPDFCITSARALYSTVKEDRRSSVKLSRFQHGIVLRMGGNTRYTFDDRVIVTRPGDLLYIGKGIKYTVDQREGGECLLMNFHTQAEYEPDVRLLHPKSMDQYESLFRRAIRYDAENCQMGVKATLYEIFALIFRTIAAEYCPDFKANLLTPALEAFDCSAPQSVAELASLCGISETYFRQLFSAVYGRNPSEYFLNLRIEKAKLCLQDGKSIAHSAEMTGFADASYFTKVFRRVTGMLPGDYLRELDI